MAHFPGPKTILSMNTALTRRQLLAAGALAIGGCGGGDGKSTGRDNNTSTVVTPDPAEAAPPATPPTASASMPPAPVAAAVAPANDPAALLQPPPAPPPGPAPLPGPTPTPAPSPVDRPSPAAPAVPAPSPTPPAPAPSLKLAWQAPTQNADAAGTALNDLAGYRVYVSKVAGQTTAPFSQVASNPANGVERTQLTGLAKGTYFVKVTAIDLAGNESLPSPEIAVPFP